MLTTALLSMCSTAENLCLCQWKNIAAGETVILECTGRDVMFFAVSRLFTVYNGSL